MTNEEIEKQAIDICNGLDTTVYTSEGGLIDVYDNMEIACRAGIKAGAKWGAEHAIEWHDLRENPKDLPKECQNVLCLCNDIGYKYFCTGHLIYKTWFSNIVRKKLRVIAWCELPKYEGKE